MIYLDHAATTPVSNVVAEVIHQELMETYGNPSSLYGIGRDAKGKIEQARRVFADSIGAKPNDIILTSGASESNSTALIPTALRFKEKGRHLITSSVEHHSVLHTIEYLETQGFEVTYLPVNEEGIVSLESVREAIRPDTILVSIMYVNNETGSVNPISEIAELLKENDILFHTDAVQAYGNQEIDVERQGIDLLSTTAHKVNGPKGIGFLYRKQSIHVPHYIHGGTQENNQRAGTENTPYILGYDKAVQEMMKDRTSRVTDTIALKNYFLEALRRNGVSFEVNGSLEKSAAHILNIWIKGVQSDKLLIQADLSGIYFSAGSACTAGSLQPSHVLVSMYGKNSPRILESIRVSFDRHTAIEDLDRVAEFLATTQKRLGRS